MITVEIQKELNKYVEEINTVLRERDGKYAIVLDKFLPASSQPMILCSLIYLSANVAIDSAEKLSKNLVIERAIDTLQCMLNSLEKTEDILKKLSKKPAVIEALKE